MKLIADENIVGLDTLPSSIEVHAMPGRSIEAGHLRGADALWVRSVTRVDGDLLHDTSLRFVGTATAGTEHIDKSALRAHGVFFASAPGSNAMAVVEYVLAALLELREPWERLEEGGTLGVVGCGHVGRRLATFARGMGWHVRVNDPWIEVKDEGFEAADLNAILDCDVVTLHCSLTREAPWPSEHLLDGAALRRLREDQWLVNASRGAVIDNRALARCLDSASAPQVVLDVWEDEPHLAWSLVDQPRLRLATPHIAGYSLDAKWNATRRLFVEMSKCLAFEEDQGQALPGGRADRCTEPFAAVVADGGLHKKGSEADLFAALMRTCYDIAADDRGLRSVRTLEDVAERARGFDRLRKNYPLRRELSACIENEPSTALLELLKGPRADRFVAALRIARGATQATP